MNLTREQRIARHKDFLKANWRQLSAFSWENYLTKGIGAVLVPEADFVHSSHPQLKGLRFMYLPLSEKDKEHFVGVLEEKEIGWIQSYNPDEKVICVILREGGGISSYLFGGTTCPSMAYALHKAKEN